MRRGLDLLGSPVQDRRGTRFEGARSGDTFVGGGNTSRDVWARESKHPAEPGLFSDLAMRATLDCRGERLRLAHGGRTGDGSVFLGRAIGKFLSSRFGTLAA